MTTTLSFAVFPGVSAATKRAKQFHEELRDILNEMKEAVETLKNSL